MGSTTAITWCDHTFNPWHGCTKVSAGCDNCYAEAFSKRIGKDIWGKTADRRFFGDKHWAEPLRWDRAALETGRPALVFCASMADVFEARSDLDEHRWRLWSLIERTPHLIWQLLTKRPEQVRGMVPPTWLEAWPPTVWIGTTVEDQERAKLRVPRLLAIPARTRFLSCEPLLGPVDLTGCLGWRGARGVLHPEYHDRIQFENLARSGISWVIGGGESGPGHRPLNLDHARDLRDQCAAAGVPFFFKQVGGQRPASGGDLLDGEVLKAFPVQAKA